jgi:hypothetical protein
MATIIIPFSKTVLGNAATTPEYCFRQSVLPKGMTSRRRDTDGYRFLDEY